MLNDPFELHYGFEIDDKAALAHEISLAEKIFSEKKTSSSLPELSNNYAQSYPKNKEIFEEKLKNWIQEFPQSFDETSRLISFSANQFPNKKEFEVLMWAHYAQSGTGARLTLETDELGPAHQTFRKIKYNEEPPSLTFDQLFSNGKPDDIEKTLTEAPEIKAKHWQYENEYRLYLKSEFIKTTITNNGPLEYIPFPIKAIKRVDFGHNYIAQNRDMLIQQLRNKGFTHINFNQYSPKIGSYEFKYDPL